MDELDPTTSGDIQEAINAMTWQDADADLTHRQHIYALKRLLKDAWTKTNFADAYAVPNCFVDNDLACLLSELAIAARSTTTTTISPDFVQKLLEYFGPIEQ
jgi:hypothetical protein